MQVLEGLRTSYTLNHIINPCYLVPGTCCPLPVRTPYDYPARLSFCTTAQRSCTYSQYNFTGELPVWYVPVRLSFLHEYPVQLCYCTGTTALCTSTTVYQVLYSTGTLLTNYCAWYCTYRTFGYSRELNF
jgi:hypothetical protein